MFCGIHSCATMDNPHTRSSNQNIQTEMNNTSDVHVQLQFVVSGTPDSVCACVGAYTYM